MKGDRFSAEPTDYWAVKIIMLLAIWMAVWGVAALVH